MLLLLFATPGGAPVATSTLGFFTVSRALLVTDAGRRLQMFAVSRAVEFEGDTMSLIFPEVFDPSDVQSYTFDLTGILEASENIATATVALASGAPSSLSIGTGGRAPTVGTKTVQFWLQSNDAAMLAADAGVVVTVTTNASPSRTLQRTGVVQVRQR